MEDDDPIHEERCRRILLLTSQQELTAPAIAYTLDMPIADCYRRIARLVDAGYLTIAGYKVNARRRAHKIYRARLDGVELYFSRDRVVMRVPVREPRPREMNLEVIVPPRPKREREDDDASF